MPLTPFHLGPGLFFGMILFRFFDLLAFLIGSVFLDIEPLTVVLYNTVFLKYPYSSYPHHGILHTFLGGILIALLIALILNNYKEKIRKYLGRFSLAQKSCFKTIFWSAFLGHCLHVIFDAFMHYDVFPFWPSHFNPFLGLISVSHNYLLCVSLGIIGLVFLVKRIKKC